MLQVLVSTLLGFTTPIAASGEHENMGVVIIHATGRATGTASDYNPDSFIVGT